MGFPKNIKSNLLGAPCAQLLFQKRAETYNFLQNNTFWVLREPNFYLNKNMLKRTTVFKFMPSGRTVGQTSTSRRGAKTYNCVQNHAFWTLPGTNFYFGKWCWNVQLSSKSCLLDPPWAKLPLREEVLKRMAVFKIMPCGRSAGPTFISENGAET